MIPRLQTRLSAFGARRVAGLPVTTGCFGRRTRGMTVNSSGRIWYIGVRKQVPGGPNSSRRRHPSSFCPLAVCFDCAGGDLPREGAAERVADHRDVLDA
jgi:hypothetical protein